MSDLDPEKVINAVKIIVSSDQKETRKLKSVDDYNGGKVSMKVVRIIHSYSDYINRVVWRK